MTYTGWLASFPACTQPVHTARLYGKIFRLIKNLIRGASWIEGKSLPYRCITALLHLDSHVYTSQKSNLSEHASRIEKYYNQGNIVLVKLRTLFSLSIFHNDRKQFREETHRRSRADENQISFDPTESFDVTNVADIMPVSLYKCFSRYRRHSR